MLRAARIIKAHIALYAPLRVGRERSMARLSNGIAINKCAAHNTYCTANNAVASLRARAALHATLYDVTLALYHASAALAMPARSLTLACTAATAATLPRAYLAPRASTANILLTATRHSRSERGVTWRGEGA